MFQEIFCASFFVAINVDGIRKTLKREKRNANRKLDPSVRKRERKRIIDISQQKIGVLIITEDADIKQNRYSENQFSLLAFPLKKEAGKKVDQDREQKKRNIVQLTESIEDDTRRGQEQVFIFE